jgi:hypothetical protein
MRVERLTDLRVGRLRNPLEQRNRPDDHPRNAVAALRGLLVDERLLHRMQAPVARESLGRHDPATDERIDARGAGRGRHAVHQDRAGEALLEPAAVFCGSQAEIVAQHLQERRIRLHRDERSPSVDVKLDLVRHVVPSLLSV